MKESEIACLHKELEQIQGCIIRMAGNCFYLKGWLVSLIVAIVVLSKDGQFDNRLIGTIVILISVAFCYMDAFYLQLERRYRKLYKWVVDERLKGNNDYQYDLDSSRFKGKVSSIFCIIFTKSIAPFYGVTVVIAIMIIKFGGQQ